MAGGENGFNQAIELSADMLSNVKFVQEKRLISKFFDEISQDTGKFVFSVKVGEKIGNCVEPYCFWLVWLISKFLDKISQDTGKCMFSVKVGAMYASCWCGSHWL